MPLRFVHHNYGLQQGMDAPLFRSLHFQGSFFLREARPGVMMAGPNPRPGAIEALRARAWGDRR